MKEFWIFIFTVAIPAGLWAIIERRVSKILDKRLKAVKEGHNKQISDMELEYKEEISNLKTELAKTVHENDFNSAIKLIETKIDSLTKITEVELKNLSNSVIKLEEKIDKMEPKIWSKK